MLGYILTSLTTLLIVCAIYIYFKRHNKQSEVRVKEIATELENNKNVLLKGLDRLKSKKAEKLVSLNGLPEPIESEENTEEQNDEEFTAYVPAQQTNSNIICMECLKQNKPKIEEYNRRINEIPETKEVENSSDDYYESPNNEEELDINKLVERFDSAEEYAYHIIQHHPQSERIEWAEEYLESIKVNSESSEELTTPDEDLIEPKEPQN